MSRVFFFFFFFSNEVDTETRLGVSIVGVVNEIETVMNWLGPVETIASECGMNNFLSPPSHFLSSSPPALIQLP